MCVGVIVWSVYVIIQCTQRQWESYCYKPLPQTITLPLSVLQAVVMYRVFYRSRARSTGTNPNTVGTKSILSSKQSPNIARTESKTEFEITSIIIRQYIEKKKYDKAVETLRGLTSVHILKCLESFPFTALNRGVPASFPIWETLLVKLHNTEDGACIAHVPNSACHQLVIRIAAILAYLEHHSDPELYSQCRRVLKKVYMHYPDITEYLRKGNEELSKALYSLTLHIPLGLEPSSAVSLQQAIHDEVNASLIDLKDAIEHLEELPLKFSPQQERRNGWQHTLTQRQIQERLYFNQCILHSVSPCRRKDNLSQLREMLESRIQGDKDVLSLFANLRLEHDGLTDSEPVEPKLRQQRHSIECTMSVLTEIQNELVINSPPSSPDPSPNELHCNSSALISTAQSLDHTQFITTVQQQQPKVISRDNRSSSEKQLVRPTSAVSIASSDQLDSPLMAGVVQSQPKKKGFIRRSLRNSMKRLSSSAGNVSSNRTSTKHHNNKSVIIDEESKTKELLEARQQIASLRRRERELTDRYNYTVIL